MSRFALPRRLVGAAGLVSLVGGCSVADSLYIHPDAMRAAGYAPAAPTLCNSVLGSYSLPKTFLKVIVTRAGDAKPVLSDPVEIRRADSSLTFCLDHLADPLADDEIRIIKSSGQIDPSYGSASSTVSGQGDAANGYGSQLLEWVVSNTVDQSEYIANTLIRTSFIALSGNPDFTPLQRSLGGRADAGQNVVVLEYDPFDAERSASINHRLHELGYCLILEHFTFDPKQMTVDQYCDAPHVVASQFDKAYARYQAEPPPRISGIAYRPRVKYGLSIYQKPDPGGRGRWRLIGQRTVSLENISPLVSVGVTRSVFAARRVALKFDMGVLNAMCLVKTSELQSAVMVPYEVAKSIVALPTQIFEVKIGNVSDNSSLVTAQNNVITAQKQYLDYLTNATTTNYTGPAPTTSTPLPTLPNPNAKLTVPVSTSAVANLSELQSSILSNICANAPSIIAPTSRTSGGTP